MSIAKLWKLEQMFGWHGNGNGSGIETVCDLFLSILDN